MNTVGHSNRKSNYCDNASHVQRILKTPVGGGGEKRKKIDTNKQIQQDTNKPTTINTLYSVY